MKILKDVWYLINELNLWPYLAASGIMGIAGALLARFRRAARWSCYRGISDQEMLDTLTDGDLLRWYRFPRKANPHKYRSNNRRPR